MGPGRDDPTHHSHEDNSTPSSAVMRIRSQCRSVIGHPRTATTTEVARGFFCYSIAGGLRLALFAGPEWLSHNDVVKTVSLDQLQRHLSARDGVPRVVVGGSAVTPWVVLDAINRSVERYRFFQLNSPKGISERPGVIAETCFVGPGMRSHWHTTESSPGGR